MRHSLTEKENAPHLSKLHDDTTEPAISDEDRKSTMSLAHAKLERQKKREENFDAIMNAPPTALAPVTDKERHPAGRVAKSKWKPLDIWGSEGVPSHAASIEGLPVSEVRINTFSPASRASTLNRSMSSVSQRSIDAGPPDPERQNSQEGGYQLFARHKARRGFDFLSAYQDKSQPRQQTVEASFDQREIYQVFGSKPPGTEFIEQNVGDKNGQLQFLQHPNGDIAAHQWSSERFLWENIGQFSNIRKKLEGQLAADCLKGETADQTLQRNTLAYFRTIAKQREATVMGLQFGAKEIQATLPEVRLICPPTHSAPSAPAPLDPKEVFDAPTHHSLPPSVQTKPDETISSAHSYGPELTTSLRPNPNEYLAYGQKYFAPPESMRSHSLDIHGSFRALPRTHFIPSFQHEHAYFPRTTFNGNAGGLDDPFYSTSLPPNVSGNPPIGRSVSHLDVYDSRSPSVNYHASQAATQSCFNAVAMARSDHSSLVTPRESSLGLPTSKEVTPLTTRGDRGTAFRDQVDKFTGQAMRRSLSQANIVQSSPNQPAVHRTVLYDPMRSANASQPSSSTKPEVEPQISTQLVARDESPTLNKPARNTTLELQQQQQLTAPRQIRTYETMPNAARRGPLRRQLPVPIGNDGSPGHEWNRPPDSRICLVDPEKPWPQRFARPFFAAEATPPLAFGRNKDYDEELQDWWVNGDTLARREELYQSLMASSISDGDVATHQPPIGKQEQTSSLPEGTMTRILIPVWENLASYVQGPMEKRRDHFSRWCQPPEWCIDRSPTGNNSFFDSDWGQPPARVDQDMRYKPLPVESLRFGGFTSPHDLTLSSGARLDPRLAFGAGRR